MRVLLYAVCVAHALSFTTIRPLARHTLTSMQRSATADQGESNSEWSQTQAQAQAQAAQNGAQAQTKAQTNAQTTSTPTSTPASVPFTLRSATFQSESLPYYSGSEIRFSQPASQNILLSWTERPRRVLFLAKHSTEMHSAVREALGTLRSMGLEVVVEGRFLDYLGENGLLEGGGGADIGTGGAVGKVADIEAGMGVGVDSASTSECGSAGKRAHSESESESGTGSGGKDAAESIHTATDTPILVYSGDSSSIDLILTFGGDGLLLHCSSLHSHQSVPPVMSFDFGSLGFLSPFLYENFREEVEAALTGDLMLTLRMRLECTMIRDGKEAESYSVLNEAVIDRGPSPYLSVLDLACDDEYITTLQGDGIIFATPTGSTAYSLAAGGSIVYPSVPTILLTPICAHSLSFRPMMLPDSAVLTCEVPEDCRSSGWVSFDGKHRQELHRGEKLVVRMSPYPVPTVNKHSFTGDWLDSLRAGFMYNLRPRQSGKAPQ